MGFCGSLAVSITRPREPSNALAAAEVRRGSFVTCLLASHPCFIRSIAPQPIQGKALSPRRGEISRVALPARDRIPISEQSGRSNKSQASPRATYQISNVCECSWIVQCALRARQNETRLCVLRVAPSRPGGSPLLLHRRLRPFFC
jgi:hypothetical protein